MELKVIEPDILSCGEVKNSAETRCYFCKKECFSALRAETEKDGYNVVIDGTNASDDEEDRPGLAA